MASLDDAFSTSILNGDVPLKTNTHPVAGVLIGRVVNATYSIYIDDNSKYYVESNKKRLL